MAPVARTKPAATSNQKTGLLSSPFFKRGYGGFTSEHEKFYLEQVGLLHGAIVLDPMGGQGYSLARISLRGAQLWLGDFNPAPLLLGMLRGPDMVRRRVELSASLLKTLKRLSLST